mmetsp:Transcript_18722/g.38960  ORF Transcript_18722/g.38960 Transcript_18722/m.38960 type:complete len:218 (-) Transcript_18722:893-1546(-)
MLNDPVSPVRLGTGTAEGVNSLLRVETRDELGALVKDVPLDALDRHIPRLRLVYVARGRAEDQIPPKRCLNEDSLSQNRVGAGEEGVGREVSLVTIKENVVAEPWLDLETVVTDHVCNLVRISTGRVDDELRFEIFRTHGLSLIRLPASGSTCEHLLDRDPTPSASNRPLSLLDKLLERVGGVEGRGLGENNPHGGDCERKCGAVYRRGFSGIGWIG